MKNIHINHEALMLFFAFAGNDEEVVRHDIQRYVIKYGQSLLQVNFKDSFYSHSFNLLRISLMLIHVQGPYCM